MRVIAGRAKGRKLTAPEGEHTRPTTDRFKEMLFGTLQFQIAGVRFLDLFSGSGGIAIEALSRGAQSAVMVETDAKALACIRQNLQTTGFAGQAEVFSCPVEQAVHQLAAKGQQFDIIFMDPPYNRDFEAKIACAVAEAGILAPDGLFIIESAAQTKIESAGWQIVKEKNQKVTKFTFLERLPEGKCDKE